MVRFNLQKHRSIGVKGDEIKLESHFQNCVMLHCADKSILVLVNLAFQKNIVHEVCYIPASSHSNSSISPLVPNPNILIVLVIPLNVSLLYVLFMLMLFTQSYNLISRWNNFYFYYSFIVTRNGYIQKSLLFFFSFIYTRTPMSLWIISG